MEIIYTTIKSTSLNSNFKDNNIKMYQIMNFTKNEIEEIDNTGGLENPKVSIREEIIDNGLDLSALKEMRK